MQLRHTFRVRLFAWLVLLETLFRMKDTRNSETTKDTTGRQKALAACVRTYCLSLVICAQGCEVTAGRDAAGQAA